MAIVRDSLNNGLQYKDQYPWATWFDGQVWELTQGEDFDIPVQKFQTIAYSVAAGRGHRVTTRREGDKLRVKAIGTPWHPDIKS